MLDDGNVGAQECRVHRPLASVRAIYIVRIDANERCTGIA